MLLEEDPAALIHHTVTNFNIQPDKLALARINDSISSLQQARELRAREAQGALRKLSRQVNTLSTQNKEALESHDPAHHAASVVELDTEKFRIAKAASELEIESERLEAELEALKARLAELDAQGVEGDETTRREREADDATILRLKIYRSLGIDVEADETGNYNKAIIRDSRKGDVHVQDNYNLLTDDLSVFAFRRAFRRAIVQSLIDHPQSAMLNFRRSYRSRRQTTQLFIFVSITIVLLLYIGFFSEVHPRKTRVSKELVVASIKSENTTWVSEELPDWPANIYNVDDPDAKLSVPMNKGREAMAYLTYIIDRYESLPDYSVFIHGLRYQWHNDDPIYDGVPIIRALRLSFVSKVGYAPLRCVWSPGCPFELHPLKPVGLDNGPDHRNETERAFAASFRALFPDTEVPNLVGAPCSSQFALSRQQILRRPKRDYQRFRKWLMDTDLSSVISGRVLEYAWHSKFPDIGPILVVSYVRGLSRDVLLLVMMGKSPVYCPPAGECYCQTFGICNLKCTEDRCEKRYIQPKYAALPTGWPKQGGGKDGLPLPGWNEK
ncbi:hypothetical protein FQN57_002831 [Myotisia sp. PD_48]|nr:hypothetical protein FQN57_002831 [Myotisia sp. PD_48]